MRDSMFWRVTVWIGLIGLFYVGHGLHQPDQAVPTFATPVHAGGAGAATEHVENLFTSSEDGKTIYMWRYFGARSPKLVHKAEAVLNE